MEPREGAEQPILQLRRDAGSLVGDLEPHAIGAAMDAHLHLPVRRGVLDRVVEQVEHDLPQPAPVGPRDGRAVGAHGHTHATADGPGAERGHRRLDHLAHLHGPQGDLENAGFGLRQV